MNKKWSDHTIFRASYGGIYCFYSDEFLATNSQQPFPNEDYDIFLEVDTFALDEMREGLTEQIDMVIDGKVIDEKL